MFQKKADGSIVEVTENEVDVKSLDREIKITEDNIAMFQARLSELKAKKEAINSLAVEKPKEE